MACCLLATILLAQCAETLRRWGRFLRLLPAAKESAESGGTVRRQRRSFASVPTIVLVLSLVEGGAVLGWLVVDHHEHIHQAVDRMISRLRGEEVIYMKVCTAGDSGKAARVAIATARRKDD